MAEKKCVKCGEAYSLKSSAENKWKECTKCGAIYCPTCASALPSKDSALSSEKTCNISSSGSSCGGKMKLV